MKIEFYPSSKETGLVIPPPKPAAHYVPDWYKRVPKFSEKNMVLSEESGRLDGLTMKSCAAFSDSMINGYIQETWQDIVIQYKDDTLTIGKQIVPEMVSSRGGNFHSPIGKGFYQNEFTWRSPWMPRLPKGYSMLIIHPANHVELPFETAAGIIDSDNFYHSPFGNMPFYVKYGFSGIIPAGTPMYQMIPIKRESWRSVVKEWNEEEQGKRVNMIARKAYGAYKELFHVKKDFR